MIPVYRDEAAHQVGMKLSPVMFAKWQDAIDAVEAASALLPWTVQGAFRDRALNALRDLNNHYDQGTPPKISGARATAIILSTFEEFATQ
jgi:hypothetical protein